MAHQTQTVSFRMHESLVARLNAQASERQMSTGEYARHIIIDHLSAGGSEKILEAVSMNREKLESLVRELRLSTTTLLCNAGHAEPGEALNWVRTHLGPFSSDEENKPK